jgi:hypothetical protein
VWLGDHQVEVGVVGADQQPLGRLALAVGAQRLHGLGRQRHGALAALGLGFPEDGQVAVAAFAVGVDVADVAEGLSDRQPAGSEVEVAPAQPEDLAAAQPAGGGQQHRHVQRVALELVEERGQFGGGPGGLLRLGLAWQPPTYRLRLGRVAAELALGDRVLQGPAEDGVEVADGAGRQATGAVAAARAVQVGVDGR